MWNLKYNYKSAGSKYLGNRITDMESRLGTAKEVGVGEGRTLCLRCSLCLLLISQDPVFLLIHSLRKRLHHVALEKQCCFWRKCLEENCCPSLPKAHMPVAFWTTSLYSRQYPFYLSDWYSESDFFEPNSLLLYGQWF